MIYVIGLIAIAMESVTDREGLGIVSGLIVAVGLGLLGLVLLFDL
jgi:hypothetical protein